MTTKTMHEDRWSPLAEARTFLFVPGDRPDRFDKAVRSGTDVVIIDLEDAVAPDRKAMAREATRAWLVAGGEAVVRVTASGAEGYSEDVDAVADLATAIMLSKCENSDQVDDLRRETLRKVPVIALVETPTGVSNVEAICRADGVVRLALGNVDLAAQLGVAPDEDDALLYARSRLVFASAAAGLAAPIDGVTTDVGDEARVAADGRRGQSLGFAAKMCIHPRQVAVVAEAMAPSQAELVLARAVIAFDAGGGVGVLDGEMVDAPVIARARRTVARARLPRPTETRS